MIKFNFVDELNELVRQGALSRLSDEQFIENEINRFLASQRRRDMINGIQYYKGQHDILFRKRTMIGAKGELETVQNLPNNRIIDNQYKKMVNQKTNYLLGQPITFQSNNKEYVKVLKEFFDKRFFRLIKNVGQDSLNCGIGWLFLYYDDFGEFTLKRFRPYEIIPGWKNEEHTTLDYAIRIYEIVDYEGQNEKIVQKVEVYHETGISRFILDGSRLKPDDINKSHEPYFTITNGNKIESFNWLKIPLIPFKYNSEEIPLIKNVKSIQDGLNLIISNFQNNMEEDSRNTILILINYDGENLGEFRKNLSTYGAVKMKTVDGAAGDLKTLQVQVNAQNYKAIIEIFKKAIIENAMGYDAKDDRLGGNANQLNIMSMYSDIDLDANEMETEYQASFDELIYFINLHLANTGMGNFENENLEVIFNRDMLISETDIISNIQKSTGLLSQETLVAQHPWVDDAQLEFERLKAEKLEVDEQYKNAFRSNNDAIVANDMKDVE